MPLFTVRTEVFRLRQPWPAAGGGALVNRAVIYVEGRDESGAMVAIGEAAPALGRGETVQEAVAWMRAHATKTNLLDHEACMAYLAAQTGVPPAAAAAFEIAALDYQSRRAAQPLWRSLNLTDPNGAVSPPLIVPATAADWRAQLQANGKAPAVLLRLGLGGARQDIECAQTVRIKTDAALRVDAAGAWRPGNAPEIIRSLAALGVEYVQQPLPRGQTEETAALRKKSPIAIFLDEDVATAQDVERVAAACDGVRISIMRAGGVSQALRAIIRARELGLLVCLGCGLESPVAASAAAHLASLADYCDFGATAFLINAHYAGVEIANARIELPLRPGLGVILARPTGNKRHWREPSP